MAAVQAGDDTNSSCAVACAGNITRMIHMCFM